MAVTPNEHHVHKHTLCTAHTRTSSSTSLYFFLNDSSVLSLFSKNF